MLLQVSAVYIYYRIRKELTDCWFDVHCGSPRQLGPAMYASWDMYDVPGGLGS